MNRAKARQALHLALSLITLQFVVSQFTSRPQSAYKLAATKCKSDSNAEALQCYNTNKSTMNGGPSISSEIDYVRIESDDCVSNGLLSLNQSECEALTTDLHGIYNTFIDPGSVLFNNIVRIEQKSCAELGYEDLSTSECKTFGRFTVSDAGQDLFPQLKGFNEAACGGDGECNAADTPRGCVGTGSTAARGLIFVNNGAQAGTGTSNSGTWDYDKDGTPEKVTCRPRDVARGFVPCYCKRTGLNLKTTEYTVIPKECTAVNRRLFHNLGTDAGESSRACGNPSLDGAKRYPCFCKRGFCQNAQSCVALNIGNNKCGCLQCSPGYFFDPSRMEEDANGCVKCASGKYRGVDQSHTTCLECPPGRYSGVGAVSCELCEFGEDACQCAINEFFNNITKICSPCEDCPVGSK